MHLGKSRIHACTFRVERKEINVVKVRFTKVITYYSLQLLKTNCLYFPGYKWKRYFIRQKNIFIIPKLFQTRPGDLGKKVHACTLRFSTLNKDPRHPSGPKPSTSLNLGFWSHLGCFGQNAIIFRSRLGLHAKKI